jgi:diguanylate cyclase (GGDEF)-like protein
MNLDLNTLLIVNGLVVVLCGVSFVLNTALRRNDPVGRLWSIAFVMGMLTALSYAVWGTVPDAWWAVAIGNAAFVTSLGAMWSGARIFNGRRSWFFIVGIAAILVAANVVVYGPNGGDWAGGEAQLGGVALFAALAGIETLRGRLNDKINARILSAVLWTVAVFFGARLLVFVTLGPLSEVFQTYFNTLISTFIATLLTLSAALSMSILRTEWSAQRPGDAWGRGRGTAGEAQFSMGVLSDGAFARGAEDRVERARLQKQPIAMIGAEVDNLTDLNNAFSRSLGDQAIARFAAALREQAPLSAIIGHNGGGRFTILAIINHEREVQPLIERVQTALVDQPLDRVTGIRISASFGVATTTRGPADYATLSEQVQTALRAARAAGGNRSQSFAALR